VKSSTSTRVTATGDVATRNTYLRAASLTAGSDAATLVVRAGGSGGAVLFTLKAPASTSVGVPDLHDLYAAGGVHATLTGTAPEATLVYA